LEFCHCRASDLSTDNPHTAPGQARRNDQNHKKRITRKESQEENHNMIKLQTTLGTILLELDFDRAPASAQNFQQHVEQGFYNGTLFHRVIDNFMIQGGGFEPGMKQKATGSPVENEADNDLLNKTGTVAMARTADPHSATAQFFINVADNDFLNHRDKSPQGWGYAVFGKVVDGMDVVEKITQCETAGAMGHQDVPVDDIVIESATVVAADPD